jgi:hypothetical protein
MTYKHIPPKSYWDCSYNHVKDWWKKELNLPWGEPTIDVRKERWDLYANTFFINKEPKVTTPSIRFINRND